MAGINLKGIRKAYGEVEVIPSIDLQIADGEFVVLVGPSGCGKSTTLRMIAGLETSSGGQLFIGDKDVTDLRPGLRNCAMVFQSYALYPHMTVRENIGYGMKVRGVDKATAKEAVGRAAQILNLTDYLDRKPAALSGGQRQRVAIGRAIVRDPDVFLFDEPLSNLDAKLRVDMRVEIKQLHRRLKTTMVYVTHDQVEAMTMADRVVVMRAGRIEQAADPITLYERPVNRFVAGFIGAPSMNFIQGKIVLANGSAAFESREGQRITLPQDRAAILADYVGEAFELGIRPEHTALAQDAAAHMSLRVIETEPLGPHTLVIGEIEGEKFTAQVHSSVRPAPGDMIPLTFETEKLHLFRAVDERAIR
ncbi:ABC transporter ATP-binding protein [Phaeovulum sp. W22_SRMD_FR3]|uniref:ABC transporter ATP-binding protein n=1 Tax=Phaeovulum sp. W22_SRMD_FR3 TaxID=3240274 RepID=UPI003F95ABC7